MMTLKLTQNAYIEGTAAQALNLITADGTERPECIWGPWYTAHAKDEDGNDYRVYWRIRDDFDPDADQDEGDACDWDEPVMIIDEEGNNLVAAGIDFEID